jgi:hypothetical protein
VERNLDSLPLPPSLFTPPSSLWYWTLERERHAIEVAAILNVHPLDVIGWMRCRRVNSQLLQNFVAKFFRYPLEAEIPVMSELVLLSWDGVL